MDTFIAILGYVVLFGWLAWLCVLRPLYWVLGKIAEMDEPAPRYRRR